MNKRFNVWLLLSGLLVMAAGCGKEDSDESADVTIGNGDIRFEIGFAPTTRVYTGSFECYWEKGDTIGLFAYDDNNALVFDNEKLVYNGSEWESDGLYWRGRKLYFYAYYPYDATVSDLKNMTFRVKSDQSSVDGTGYGRSDFMTAMDCRGLSKGDRVYLDFGHKFAMIQVEIPAQGKGWGPSEDMTVILKGVQTEVTLDMTLGPLTEAVLTNAGAENVKMYLAGKPKENGYINYTYRALVPVQTLKGGEDLFYISTEKELYKCAGPDNDLMLLSSYAEIFTYSLPVSGNSLHRVFIPAGKFMMGDANGYSSMQPVHEVTLSKGFYMSKYEITNAQYAAFLNDTGVGEDGKGQVSYPAGDGTVKTEQQLLVKMDTDSDADGVKYENGSWKPQNGKGDHPVVCVTWYGAKAFADWVGGCLPTEAQWEYACRAGTTTTYFFGDDSSDLDKYAWTRSNSGRKTHEVGTLMPNPWGLHGMHGNVCEWCANWTYSYPDGAVTDPAGPDTGYFRVARGGSCVGNPQMCSSAYRLSRDPNTTGTNLGFRVAFES